METTFKIMIVEDEGLMADKMEMQIDKLGYQHFGTVDNSEDALKLLETSQPDLILMDVNIEGEYDGIELTDMIHQQWEIPIIFITSLHDNRTSKRIIRTNPVAYIIKPFSDAQLKTTVELIVKQLLAKPSKIDTYDLNVEEELPTQEKDFLFVKKRNELVKIKIEDIFYLEADGRYTQIYTMDKKFLIRMSLKEMLEKKLDSKLFIQTHRSYIVNITKIKSVNLEDSVVDLGNMHVPLSRREKEEVLKKLDWV